VSSSASSACARAATPSPQSVPLVVSRSRSKALAAAYGQFRLAANLRQVQASLDRIIPALEALPDTNQPDHG
jgi:hypothetical protein